MVSRCNMHYPTSRSKLISNDSEDQKSSNSEIESPRASFICFVHIEEMGSLTPKIAQDVQKYPFCLSRLSISVLVFLFAHSSFCVMHHCVIISAFPQLLVSFLFWNRIGVPSWGTNIKCFNNEVSFWTLVSTVDSGEEICVWLRNLETLDPTAAEL